MSQEFECMVPIDHTADHCIYPAGALITLGHLSAEKVQLLVGRGYVRPVKAQAEAEAKAEAKAESKK
jgi:hypothetical protein